MKARFENCGIGPTSLASQPLCYAALMLEITNAVISSLELDQVLNKTVESIIRKLGVYGVALYIVTEAGQMVLKVSNLGNYPEVHADVEHFGGTIAKMVQSMRAEYCFDLGAEQCFPQQLRLGLKDRSGVCYPLIAKEELLGALWFIDETQREYMPEEKELFQGISSQIALAVYNAREFARVELLSNVDGLTGLYNHRHFHEQIERELLRARRGCTHLSMVMLDVDNFKNYNDLYGHPAGDKLLKQIAQIIKDSLRKSDMVARYGGEEFAVILPETGPQGAYDVAERIRTAIAGCLFTGGKKMPKGKITVSLGVSTYPEHGSDAVELIKAADRALYQAKSTRNRVEIYNPVPNLPEEIIIWK